MIQIPVERYLLDRRLKCAGILFNTGWGIISYETTKSWNDNTIVPE